MKSKLNSLSLRSIGEVVSRSSRRRIYGFAVARALDALVEFLAASWRVGPKRRAEWFICW